MYSIANNAKPAILTRTESRIQSQRDKRTRDTEAREQWENDKAKMRARLREMIANRAPLELRAALVASVYGEPGRAADEGEE